MKTLNFKKTCRRILSNAAVLLSAAGLCIAVPQGCTDLGTETSSRSHEGISGNAGEKVRVIFKPYIEYPETKAADNSVRNIIVAVYGGGTLVESLDLDSGAEASVELESGKDYSYYAAANIATAIENFRDRGYATLGGIILNRKNVKDEDQKVAEFAEEFHSSIVGTLDRSDLVQQAEEMGKTVVEAFPDSEMAGQYRTLAKAVLEAAKKGKDEADAEKN